jgi:thiamine pyrophosphate-dependent acetolactate synthase large subunit-like protein
LLFRLFRPQSNYTVVLDDQPVGTIGKEQVRVFEEGEERQFVCGANGMGWPTLREASPEDLAEIRRTSGSEPPQPGDPVSPN